MAQPPPDKIGPYAYGDDTFHLTCYTVYTKLVDKQAPYAFPAHQSSKSPNEKPECEHERWMRRSHLRMTATTTKSTFCALHGLHDINDVTKVQMFKQHHH